MSDLQSRIKALFADSTEARSFADSVGRVFIIRVVGLAITFLAQVFLARVLGPSNYGQYVYAFNWIVILAILGKMGMDVASVRFIAQYVEQRQWGLLRGFLRVGNRITLSASFITSMIAAAVIWGLHIGSEDGISQLLLISMLGMPLYVHVVMRIAVLQGYKRVEHSTWPQFILRPLLLILGVAVIAEVTQTVPTATVTMQVHLFAMLVIIMVMRYLIRKHGPIKLRKYEVAYDAALWSKVGLSFIFLSGLNIILSQTDIAMIGILRSTTEVGIYSATFRLVTLVTIGASVVSAVVMPIISQYYSSNNLRELQKIISIAAIAVAVFTILVSAIYLVAGKWILSLFGATFTGGYIAMTILIAGQTVTSLMGSTGQIMSMAGYEKVLLKLISVATVINLLLNWYLIPLYGINGAAISTASTMASMNIILMFYIRSNLGLNTTVFRNWARL